MGQAKLSPLWPRVWGSVLLLNRVLATRNEIASNVSGFKLLGIIGLKVKKVNKKHVRKKVGKYYYSIGVVNEWNM